MARFIVALLILAVAIVNCNGLTARSCYCDQCAGNTVLGCCLYRDQPIQNTTGQGDTPLGFSNTVIPGTDTTAEGGNPSPNPCVAVPLIPTNAVNLVHVAMETRPSDSGYNICAGLNQANKPATCALNNAFYCDNGVVSNDMLFIEFSGCEPDQAVTCTTTDVNFYYIISTASLDSSGENNDWCMETTANTSLPSSLSIAGITVTPDLTEATPVMLGAPGLHAIMPLLLLTLIAGVFLMS